MKIVIGIILAAYLLPAAVADIKKKSIDVRILAGFFLAAVLVLLISGEELFWWNRILGLFPGALLLLISYLSHGAVGKGDAYVLFFMGYVLGLLSVLEILFWAWAACFVAAAYFFIKKKKNKRLPFIPFLAVSFLCCYTASFF